jgi:hypothetical protein
MSPDPDQATIGVSCEIALPDAHDRPSSPAQGAGGFPVTRLVSTDLFLPRVRVCLWGYVAAAVVTVPETPINEHG